MMNAFFIEGFIFHCCYSTQNIFNSLGRSGMSLRIDVVKKALTLSSIFLVFTLGIRALILGQVVSTFIAFVLSFYSVSRVLNFDRLNAFSGDFKDWCSFCRMFGVDILMINKLSGSAAMMMLVKTRYPCVISSCLKYSGD